MSIMVTQTFEATILVVPNDNLLEVEKVSPLIKEPDASTLEKYARQRGIIAEDKTEQVECRTGGCSGHPVYCAACQEKGDPENLKQRLTTQEVQIGQAKKALQQTTVAYQKQKVELNKALLDLETLNTKYHDAQKVLDATVAQVEQLRRSEQAYAAALETKDKQLKELEAKMAPHEEVTWTQGK